MGDDRLRAEKLDALQRVGPFPDIPGDVPLTAAPVDNRRLCRLLGIGCQDKEWQPPAAAREDLIPNEDLLVSVHGHGLRLAFYVEHSGADLGIHLGTWEPATSGDARLPDSTRDRRPSKRS